MTKLESLRDIKDTAVRLHETLMGSDIESIRIAKEAFQQLVDRFYQENEGPYGSETRAERFFKRRQCKREGKGCQVFLYDCQAKVEMSYSYQSRNVLFGQ